MMVYQDRTRVVILMPVIFVDLYQILSQLGFWFFRTISVDRHALFGEYCRHGDLKRIWL